MGCPSFRTGENVVIKICVNRSKLLYKRNRKCGRAVSFRCQSLTSYYGTNGITENWRVRNIKTNLILYHGKVDFEVERNGIQNLTNSVKLNRCVLTVYSD